MYDIKALYEASDVDDAIRLLAEHPDAQIIAGGSDVLVQIREGRRAGCEFVSIYGIDSLRGVSMEENGDIRIGALTSFAHITGSPIISEHVLALGEAVDKVGGPQIRAIGTIGGNTCNGVTSADSASTLMAYDAVMEIAGPGGRRRTPIREFYKGAKRVDLSHEEILTAVIIPRESHEGYDGYYIKYGMRNAMEIATTGCSVNVKLSDDRKIIKDIRIGYGVAAPVPIRAVQAENGIKGRPVSAETLEKIGEAVLCDVTPRDSWRASKDLRLHLCSVMAKEAALNAIRRNGGDIDV